MIVEPDGVAGVIRGLLRKTGISANEAITAVPGPAVIIKKVTVKDRTTGKEAVLSRDVQIEEMKFGFIRPRFTSTASEPAPPYAVPGQALLLHFALVGYEPNKMKVSDVDVEIQILDSEGKPTTAKSAKSKVQQALKDEQRFIEFLPIPLQLNRAGKFKVVMKAKCSVSGKTAEQALDLTVLDR